MRGVDYRAKPLISPRKFFLPKEAYSSLEGILIPYNKIQVRIRQMSSQIADDYKEKDLYALTVLNGAIPFFTDLLFHEQMALPFDYGCVKIKSYQGTQSSSLSLGEFDLAEVKGKDVLIVDDILDTGKTLSALVAALGTAPKSVNIAVLLDKSEKREIAVHAEYVGFIIPNSFVVGYGMDYENQFRYLHSISVLKEDAYTTNQKNRIASSQKV